VTWVVGAGTVDFGVLVGDIRVSYDTDNGLQEEEHFGVRKLHQVNPSTWMGFAGSILVGFEMAERLRLLALRLYQDVGGPPDAEEIVNHFVTEIGPAYQSFDQRTREAGCHLLIVGASAEPVEFGGRPLFHVARSFIVRFPRPGHSEIAVEQALLNHFATIGSGSQVEEYRQHLDDSLANGKQGLLNFAPSSNPSSMTILPMVAYLTSLGLGSVVQQSRRLGISSQMHAALITPGGTLLGDNAGAELSFDGGRKGHVPPFPPIAESWAELLKLCQQFGTGGLGIAVA
jgi:hypothetical protein